ncbi:TauD/TfdA family dioxygenase [Flavicella sediminum]|uniref:TauD/TfdA family dioxygenase n=1 Tax=Flavicella sediminum TaxID=2585141 RepID=UPI0011248189|nr:TauD/TfdA family dioxygenase [Flavicella sediminum]
MSKNKLAEERINYLDYNSINGGFDELSKRIVDDLENVGYVVVQNFDVDVTNVEASGQLFLKISEMVGTPIPHAGNDTIIWDIKSNPKSDSLIKTYSEHSHEAQMHTDSQYSFYPEDYFGLLTLKKAECGGGISYLVSLKDLLDELRLLPNGEQIIDTLSNTDYPFIVPNVFKKSKVEGPEFNYGPILRDNEIRFRIDTFEKALNYKQGICDETQIDAYKKLKHIVLSTDKIKNFYLNENDLIFINNKTMLHGRGQFTDQSRHLLRIRINK